MLAGPPLKWGWPTADAFHEVASCCLWMMDMWLVWMVLPFTAAADEGRGS